MLGVTVPGRRRLRRLRCSRRWAAWARERARRCRQLGAHLWPATCFTVCALQMGAMLDSYLQYGLTTVTQFNNIDGYVLPNLTLCRLLEYPSIRHFCTKLPDAERSSCVLDFKREDAARFMSSQSPISEVLSQLQVAGAPLVAPPLRFTTSRMKCVKVLVPEVMRSVSESRHAAASGLFLCGAGRHTHHASRLWRRVAAARLWRPFSNAHASNERWR